MGKRSKSLLVICFSIFMLWNNTINAQAIKTEIDIQIRSLPSKTITIAYQLWEKIYIKDTLVLDQLGKAKYQPESGLEKGVYYIVIPPKNNYFEIIIDSEGIFAISADTADFINTIKITGSKQNESYYAFLKDLETHRGKARLIKEDLTTDSTQKSLLLGKVDEEVKKIQDRYIQLMPGSLLSKMIALTHKPDYKEGRSGKEQDSIFYIYRKACFQQLDFSDSRLLRTTIFPARVIEYLDQLTVNHPDSLNIACNQILKKAESNPDVFRVILIELLNKYAKGKYVHDEDVYAYLGKEYYMTGKASWVSTEDKEKIANNVKIILPTLLGHQASNIELFDESGTLSQLRDKKAKGFVLFLYSTDCPDCEKSLTKLAATEKLFRMDEIMFITVMAETKGKSDGRQKLEGLKTKFDMTGFLNFTCKDKTYLRDQFNCEKFPKIFILDADQKIYMKRIDENQVEAVLNKYLNK